MDAPVRLLLTQPPPCSLSDHRMLRTLPYTTTAATFSYLFQNKTGGICICICSAKKRPWDSNAESFRNRSFDCRDGEEDAIDNQDWIEQGSGFLENVVDNIFIFKVLKSYGWMLPFIIISMLLVSGPKAFVYTLGLAIGLSLIAYAFQSWTQTAPGRKSKRKKRSSNATNRSNAAYAEPDKVKRTRKKESAVSWAARNDDSVGKTVQDKPFGGWDELDEAIGSTDAPLRKPYKADSKETVESMTEPVKTPDQTRVRAELNRLNRRRREMSRTPLLLRLLIAAFPFLSSWIKMP